MGKQRMRAMMGATLLVVAGIVLVSTFALSWYTVSATSSGGAFGGSIAVDFHPNQVVATAAGISVTAGYSGSPLNLNHTGNLYMLVEGLIVGGLILGLIGGIFGLMISSRPRMKMGAVACGILALILAIAGPLVLVAGQPAAIASDSTNAFVPTNSSIGPGATFMGSASISGSSATWGPAIGFYLALVAGVLFLLGSLMLIMAHPERDKAAAAVVCGQCGASFSSAEELNSHSAAAHPAGGMPPTPPGA